MITALVQKNNKPVCKTVKDRATAAYLGLAIGDALGATVEFMTPNEIRVAYGVHKNIIGGGWLKLKPGSVTDDTEMSLALGESIIQQGVIDAQDIAEAFSQWMHTKPVDIGHTVRRGIMHYRSTGETCVAENDFNAGNGACMRTLPVALATLGGKQECVINASQVQAHITHHARLSDVGVEHIIKLIQAALQEKYLLDLEKITTHFIKQNPQFQFNKKPMENPGGFIVDTLQAVFQSFYNTHSFESCLVNVVNKGGDADTTGAIAGMLAGALYGMESIPTRWIKALNPHTVKQCRRQAARLIALAPVA